MEISTKETNEIQQEMGDGMKKEKRRRKGRYRAAANRSARREPRGIRQDANGINEKIYKRRLEESWEGKRRMEKERHESDNGRKSRGGPRKK